MEHNYTQKYMPDKEKNTMNTNDKILQSVAGYAVPKGISKEEAFEKLMLRIETETKPNKQILFGKTYIYWSVAASILLVAGALFFLNYNKTTTIVADNGTQKEYTLPDGSIVTLNASTEIAFKPNKFKATRTLNLKGEAFFEVKKGNEFIITTLQGKIEVLGTTFNVVSRNNNFQVSCSTGKVRVVSGNNTQVITRGETVTKIDNKLIKKSEDNIERIATWRNGEFYFENTPVISIFDEIERQFNVSINANNLENRYFTGSFSNKNLNETLDIICIPMELDYEIQSDNTIRIYKKK